MPQIILKDDEREGEVRIRPDVLQTALLDDMVFRLISLEKVMLGIGVKLEELTEIKDQLKLLTEKNITLNYPRTAKKLLPVGETVIAFKNKQNKQVILPDDSREDMYCPVPIELCKSATIYTDADITVDFLLEGIIIFTGLITPPGARIPNVWFDRVEINTVSEALFYISMSTFPDGAPEDISLERPVLLDSKNNESVIAATDIFDDDLSPLATPTYFRIYVAFDAAGVLTVRRTKSGTTTSEELNSGDMLDANAAHVFDIVMDEGETMNLHYSVGATALKLIVTEIGGGI